MLFHPFSSSRFVEILMIKNHWPWPSQYQCVGSGAKHEQFSDPVLDKIVPIGKEPQQFPTISLHIITSIFWTWNPSSKGMCETGKWKYKTKSEWKNH